MNVELDGIRGRFLVVLFWLHVQLLAAVALYVSKSTWGAALAGVLLAGAYRLSRRYNGIAPATRYVSAVDLWSSSSSVSSQGLSEPDPLD